MAVVLGTISHPMHLFIFGMEKLNIRELIICPHVYSQLVKEMGFKVCREQNERGQQGGDKIHGSVLFSKPEEL